MLAEIARRAPAGGGHPAWHFGAVAAAAVGVFVFIKVSERRHERPSRVSLPARPRPTRFLVLLALASAGCSAIHAAVCPEHFREATAFGVFFLLASAAQAAWAIAVVVRPSRTLLSAGAVGNAGVVLLWGVTRAIGLPIGPEIWRPEAITVADALATQLEVGIVVGLSWVLSTQGRRRLVVT